MPSEEGRVELGPQFWHCFTRTALGISTTITQQGFQLQCDGVGEENVVPVVPLVLEKHLSSSL